MNVIDTIIANRSELMAIAAVHGVTALKLYGSVLARTEKPESDIDFLAVFDPNIPYEWDATFELKDKLEAFFNRRVSLLDSRRIPEVFHPQIDIDPKDIMLLEAGKQYTITPKTSKLYYIMLDKLLTDYFSTRVSRLADSKGLNFNVFDLDPKQIEYSPPLIGYLAKKISWWFSRLLRLEDNDLRTYEGFDFVEVLYICYKLFDIYEQTLEYITRFKELLPAIKEYVDTRLPM